MTSNITNPTPVGRSGPLFLLAQADDLAAGNLNGPAQTHNTRDGLRSEAQPLQVWFKWINWEDTTEAEYEAAQPAIEKARRPTVRVVVK